MSRRSVRASVPSRCASSPPGQTLRAWNSSSRRRARRGGALSGTVGNPPAARSRGHDMPSSTGRLGTRKHRTTRRRTAMSILVTGATGAVGRHLVSTLIERGARVRALTRKPDHAGLPHGVDVVAGDLTDALTLAPSVFEDVDRAFVFPAQGVDAFVGAAVAAGVHRFTVLSSLAAALEFPRDHGSASQLHHSAVEAAVTGRTDAWTILRPGTFANNLLSWTWQIRSGAPIRAPFLASAQAPIHEHDVAEAAAEALLADDHLGEAISMTGPEA